LSVVWRTAAAAALSGNPNWKKQSVLLQRRCPAALRSMFGSAGL
jgi:hypothetical protein